MIELVVVATTGHGIDRTLSISSSRTRDRTETELRLRSPSATE
jgi:hypothetical protein